MSSIVSPNMSAAEFARLLSVDVRTLRRAVDRGDVPAPTGVDPVSGRALWNRSEMSDYFRTLSAELKATSDLVDVLQDITNDKTESVEGRQLAIDILSAIVSGDLDPVAELAELQS